MSQFDFTEKMSGRDGGGRPQSYYYLWHLVALGVIDAEFGPPRDPEDELSASAAPTITGTVWDEIGAAFPQAFEPAVVALIDVGVSRLHPNLRTRIDDRSIDLASHRYGAATQPADPTNPHEREQEAPFFAGLDISGLGTIDLGAGDAAFLSALVDELAASKGVVRQLADGDETFGSHGTAAAGLVVGEPAATVASEDGSGPAAIEPASLATANGETLGINANQGILPYFGVDPFSRLLSIRTSFDTDAEQFIAAFLYAWHCGVDVILLPRGLPDPVRSRVAPKPELAQDGDLRANRERAGLFARLADANGEEIDPYATALASDREWTILEKLIVAISRKIPVICAAGNDGESQIIYPAKLAAPDNGVVAVGAVTPRGLRSGFSNYGEGLTLVAPADDSEVFNRHQLRRDTTHPAASTDYFDAGRGKIVPYSPFALVTTDLPGIYGYEAGSPPRSARVPPFAEPGTGGGYYTTFGGTSGASALVAGVAALAARANKARHGPGASLTGVAAKELLVRSSRPETSVRPGTAQLAPDPINADDEPSKGLPYYFGAGLLDARRVVAEVLTS